MEIIMQLFDVLLCMVLVFVAWQALTSTDLFRAIVMFIAFGLLMAISWVRLNAIDVAIAEVAIGAGLTGALLLAAFGRLQKQARIDKTEDVVVNSEHQQGR